MPVSAPPQHPGPTVTTEQDRYEALIEEARQRARRRRQTYGAVAVAIAAVVAATVVISGSRRRAQRTVCARSPLRRCRHRADGGTRRLDAHQGSPRGTAIFGSTCMPTDG